MAGNCWSKKTKLAFFMIGSILLDVIGSNSFANPLKVKSTHCTMEYNPVIALKDGRCKSYSNRCWAISDGAIISQECHLYDEFMGDGLPVPWPFPW
jgi:hypothetical protein